MVLVPDTEVHQVELVQVLRQHIIPALLVTPVIVGAVVEPHVPVLVRLAIRQRV